MKKEACKILKGELSTLLKLNKYNFSKEEMKKKLGNFGHTYILIPILFVVAIIFIIADKKLRNDAIEMLKKKGESDD